MLPSKAIKKLEALSGGDPEADHGEADKILLDFLRSVSFGSVADAFEKARTSGGWWYA